jgi:hypothetical protein
MNEKQLKDLIDRVLEKIDLYSKDAADLVLKTMKVESRLEYIRQIKGPAVGLGQCGRLHNQLSFLSPGSNEKGS